METDLGNIFLSRYIIIILYLFTPGIISYLLFSRISYHKQPNNFVLVLYSLILSIMNHFIVFIVIFFFNIKKEYQLVDAIFSDDLTKWRSGFNDFLLSIIVAIIIGTLILPVLYNHRVSYRILKKFKITTKTGFPSIIPERLVERRFFPRAIIHNIKENIIYDGYIKQVDEQRKENCEILFEKCNVSIDGKAIYENSSELVLRLSKDTEYLIIFPHSIKETQKLLIQQAINEKESLKEKILQINKIKGEIKRNKPKNLKATLKNLSQYYEITKSEKQIKKRNAKCDKIIKKHG